MSEGVIVSNIVPKGNHNNRKYTLILWLTVRNVIPKGNHNGGTKHPAHK